MKKKYFVLLLLFLGLSLTAQDEINSSSNLSARNKSLLEQLKEEKKELAILEEELAYYHNLLQQRVTVRKLYKQKKLSSIENVFSKTTKIIDRMFDENLIKKASLKIGELELIYKDIDELKDQVLYYQGKLAFIKGNNKKAQDLLEKIVEDYPHSSILNPAILILEEIYFVEGLDQEFINIFDRYTAEKSLRQNYWLSQVYYNVGRYSEALDYLNILIKNKEFAFRAKAMIALISYYTEGLESSIAKFNELENKYNKRTDYYDFVLISLARLNIANNDFNKALIYYDDYYNLTNDIISDDILYEMAIQNYNKENYPKAIKYFNLIIDRPIKSQYYASAKFFVAVSEQGSGNYEYAENTLSEMISQNNVLMETMNTKYDLLEKYNTLRKKINRENITEEELSELESQSDKLEKAIAQTNETMNQLYTGLDSRSLNTLQIMEEEYLSYSSTIADMDAVILLAEKLPNKKIPKIIDREIAYSDSSIITLQVLSYLGHRPQFSRKDYGFAKALAYEKISQQDLLTTWDEIEQIAIQNNHEEILPSIHISKQAIRENLESIDIIAQYMFKGKPSDDFQNLIKEEALAIENNKLELQVLKKDIIANFNKMIARRLSNEKEILITEFEGLQFIYDNILSELITEIINTNNYYNFSLLNILFKQTQILDSEYKEFQEKVKYE